MFFRTEAKLSDVLGSLWGTLLSSGFMLSTLQPILVIIRIYDSSSSIPSYLFDLQQEDEHLYEREVNWLTEDQRYALKM